jgi:hypothetical protein
MKKSLFFITALFTFFGCEESFDPVIEPVVSEYQVISVNQFQYFEFIPGDSVKTIAITFNSTNSIKNVSYTLQSPSGASISSIEFTKSSTNSYSAPVAMSRIYVNGKYSVRYYVTDIYDVTKEAAVHYFEYNNGSGNIPPVIDNAIISPDTLVVNDTTLIKVTVEAFDEDGQDDIELVYFLVYRPNGTTSGNQNILYDNGVHSVGDDVPGDGIFSRVIFVDQSNAKGIYRFEFRARDRRKALSNIISYNVLIQ